MHTIERFVILLYDRTSTCNDIDKARKKLFAKKNNVQLIPPIKAALEEHVKRAAYQGGHVWGQTLLPTPELPPPSSWGWVKNDEGVYEPHWTKLPKAAHTCYELVSCKCKKSCLKRCKCKKAALECRLPPPSSVEWQQLLSNYKGVLVLFMNMCLCCYG